MSGLARPFPRHAVEATVTARVEVTPRMARFTLAHEAFGPGFGVEQPGEIVTLGWGDPLVLPEGGWRFPGGAKQHWRNFTVRAWRPSAGEVDVDFFLHGDLGEAAAWGLRAQPGARIGLAGPRVHWEPDPVAEWSLLLADETGLPALLAILESLPAGHRAIAVAEVHDDAERQPAEVVWASRGGAEPGTTSVLLDAVAALELPDAPGQIWAGGEALAVRDLRSHLSERVPNAASSMRALGYWKHRTTPEDVI